MTQPHENLIDINLATLQELTTIHGIGPVLAAHIIEQRPFEKIEDLERVSGINHIKFLSIAPFVTVSEKKPRVTPRKTVPQPEAVAHASELGETEAFVFLEDHNQRQDALLIIFGGFILGLVILLLRRSRR